MKLKWVFYAVLLFLAASSWMSFSGKGREMEKMREQITQLEEQGDPEEEIPALEGKISSLDGDRTFSGILLTFVTAGIVGIFVVVYLLPFFAHRVTHAVYDSGEMVEKDVMSEARSLMAQGDYEGAVEAYKRAAEADPLNRLPWVEIAKIYKDHLDDPASAIQTFRNALESQEWQVNDAAFFCFRLAEMYDEHEGNRASARAIMQQVIDEFPNTRHSANAKHKLHEWDLEDGDSARAREEAAFLARQSGGAARPVVPPLGDKPDQNA